MLATATHSVVISADCTMQNSTRSLVPVHITVLHVRVMQIQVKSSSWGSLRPSLCPTYCKVHTVYNSHLAACLQGCGSILERVPVYRTYYSHPECVHLSWEAGDKDAGNTSRQRLHVGQALARRRSQAGAAGGDLPFRLLFHFFWGSGEQWSLGHPLCPAAEAGAVAQGGLISHRCYCRGIPAGGRRSRSGTPNFTAQRPCHTRWSHQLSPSLGKNTAYFLALLFLSLKPEVGDEIIKFLLPLQI